MQTVIGKLVNASNNYWFFVTENGEEFRIYFEGDDRPPVETKIALSISDQPEYEDGGYACVTEGMYWEWITEPYEAAANPYVKRIAVYWQHYPGKDEEREMRQAREWAQELECFYKMYSRKRWDVTAKPFLWKGIGKPEPPSYCMNSIANEVDVGDFNPTHHHVVSIHQDPTKCGVGNVHGNLSCTYLYSGCNVHTEIHELGHNFGMSHANTDSGGEYADITCVMGRGPRIPGLNSPHLLQLDLETERERIDINRSTQLLLCPIEMPEHAMHNEEWQHVVLEKDGHDKMYVSMRKARGWPWTPGGKYKEDRVFIHYKKDRKTWLWDTMGPNATENPKRLPNGVKLAYLEYANETARVEFDYNDGITPTPVQIPTGFPEVLTGAELGPQHAGLWYDKDLDGQGFDLSVKDDEAVLYWYSYNVNENSRRFFFSNRFKLSAGSEEFDLYTTHDGTFADPKSAVVEKVGEGQIYFYGPDRGVFNYRTSEHGRGSVEITPVAVSQDQRNGLWYEPAKDKSGFSVKFFPNLNKAIMFWYNYGEKVSSYERDGYKTQRWWYCDCAKATDMNYAVTIYEARGGKFGMPIRPEMDIVGTGTLTLVSLNKMRFDYDISADPSTTGSGILDLEKLF